MSMKLTSFLPLTLALALTACGFEPMYGDYAPSNYAAVAAGGVPSGAPEAALDKVDIAVIPNAEGVYLRNLLIDRFYQNGYPSNPAFTLQFSEIAQSRSDLDITRESEATRRLLTVSTNMTLIDTATRQPVLQRDFRVVNSYDVIGSQFSTRIAEQDALEAALADIARQTELQIALFLNRGQVGGGVTPAPASATTTGTAPVPATGSAARFPESRPAGY